MKKDRVVVIKDSSVMWHSEEMQGIQLVAIDIHFAKQGRCLFSNDIKLLYKLSRIMHNLPMPAEGVLYLDLK